MSAHLTFLQFTLQQGVLYLHWHRARDIWDTLAANPDACDWDIEVGSFLHPAVMLMYLVININKPLFAQNASCSYYETSDFHEV